MHQLLHDQKPTPVRIKHPGISPLERVIGVNQLLGRAMLSTFELLINPSRLFYFANLYLCLYHLAQNVS